MKYVIDRRQPQWTVPLSRSRCEVKSAGIAGRSPGFGRGELSKRVVHAAQRGAGYS